MTTTYIAAISSGNVCYGGYYNGSC